MRAVTGALDSLGPETVWRTWAEPPTSGPSRRRWESPLVTELLADAAQVPDLLVDAAWRDWLAEPGTGVWWLLARWNRAATTTESGRVRFLSRLALSEDGGAVDARLLADAAVRFDHPIGERARARLLVLNDPEAVDLYCAAALESPQAAAFCAGHHLAPGDEVRRAVFFVRTGQQEQYRALDPDGTLLALGYRSASTEERAVLRTAITALGDIDTLQVLAGQRSRHEDVASLDRQERAYLIQQLTERGDWDRLWRVALPLPLTEAVGTVGAFGAWRPAGEDDRRVFDALRAADPQTGDGRVYALSGAPVSSLAPHTRIRLDELDQRLRGIAALGFAPDGTQLALAGPVHVGTEGDGHVPSGEPVAWAGIVDLGSGTLSRLHCDFTYPLGSVVHLGSDTMVVAEADAYADPNAVENDYSHLAKIYYVDPAGVRPVDTGAEEVFGLERVAGDRAFVVSALVEDADAFEHPVLFTGGPGGSLVPSGPLEGLDDFEPLIVAVDPGGRLVAMVDVLYEAVVADLRTCGVNRLDDGSGTEDYAMEPAALSPSTLVNCSASGDLNVWHEPLTSTEPPMAFRAWSAATRPSALAWSPALNRFLAVDVVQGPHLEILEVPPTRDATVTEPAPDFVPDLVAERIALAENAGPAPIVRLSPRGDLLAVGKGGHQTVDLYDLTGLVVRSFVTRPMGAMTHHDLAHVVEMQQRPLLDAVSRTALTLLRACLEHRLRHDVAIGTAAGAAVVAGDFEIELGEDGEE
ncbi:hypothetical protein [Streptomyces sp. AC512_CC834]|uniref:hypothetical protein n=1 Tax=Streptomyces sp. AC512_CC834 TaxID=2823691 RepID=UPI001C25CA97|nr:hypothetical protein [Streptomyces sp. AC512_CC834]